MSYPIRIFTDGACSGNGTENQKAGIGIVVEWKGKVPSIYSTYIGNRSNNEAEYEALIRALKVIKDENIKNVEINSDSNLMVNQVNGNWKCKDKKLIPLLITTQKRLNWLKERGFLIQIKWIPRELNVADTPAKNSIKKG